MIEITKDGYLVIDLPYLFIESNSEMRESECSVLNKEGDQIVTISSSSEPFLDITMYDIIGELTGFTWWGGEVNLFELCWNRSWVEFLSEGSKRTDNLWRAIWNGLKR